MTERDFDRMLEENVPELPDSIARDVTPWRNAMDNIIGGSAMCAVTVNLLGLNILLPTIGVVAQLLGFRALRRENGWLRLCWLFSVLRMALLLPDVVLNATIYNGAFNASALGGAATVVGVVVQLLLFFCFWRGLRVIRKKAGMEPEAGSAAALLVWYALIIVLAWINYQGWIVALIMLGCYFLILRSLAELSDEMAESGYVLSPAPVRVSDGALAKGIAGALVLGIVCGYLFFGSYRMNWQAESGALNGEAAQIRQELLDLGYPESALDDLSEEELLACRDAVRVVVEESDKPVNKGREVRETVGQSTYVSREYDVKELHFTDVAVQLPGEWEHWKIFHHFRWTVNPGFRGTESIQLWPTYQQSDNWSASGEPSGRVLYERGGVRYAAPYHALSAVGYTSDSIIWGDRYVSALFAEFSLPSRGEGQRGYISYSVENTGHVQEIVNSWINYTHQCSRIQYPVKTAAENRRTDSWGFSNAFFTVQNALQFAVLENGEIDCW